MKLGYERILNVEERISQLFKTSHILVNHNTATPANIS